MDYVNHTFSGVILHTFIALVINFFFSIGMTAVYIIGFTGLIGIVPDLDRSYGKLYVSMHAGKLNKIFRIIPAWGLHTGLDKHVHEIGKRWYASIDFDITGDAYFYEYFMPSQYAERMHWETISWAIIIAIILTTIFYKL
jgi:hypothetical protein